MAAICLSFSACASGPKSAGVPVRVAPDVQTLNSGDVIRITFPTNPNLDTTQTIRRDGRINLYLIGEVKVVDKTPAELERELLQAYESQLTSKEITVTVISSSITVFVAGAVARPGKVTADRALTGGHQRLAELARAGAAVQDDQRAIVGADFHARGVAAVAQCGGTGRGDGAARPPETDPHDRPILGT